MNVWHIHAQLFHDCLGSFTGKGGPREYRVRLQRKNKLGAVRLFRWIGGDGFAYAGHNVVLEIQATIPSTPENPSKRPMWKGAIVAYVFVAFCYFPVALLGFKTLGTMSKKTY